MDAVQLWRTLMGPTRVFRARHVAPDSIRGSLGLTDTRNTTHGSGESASCVRSCRQGRGLGAECQDPQVAVFPVVSLALVAILADAAPGLMGR